MAGYLDTRQMIIDTLMGRPEGTQIQPEDHQAYALNLLNYVRSVELSSGSTLTGIAEADTVPIEPYDSRVAYIASVPQNTVRTFTYFKKENNEPITITTTNSSVFVILLWNTQYWEYQPLPVTVFENDSFVGYFECASLSTDTNKTISSEINQLTTDLRILVKMNNVNTQDNATFQIGLTDAKPLYYNGSRASSTNSWAQGEVVDIYYNGTNFISCTHGGAQFSTGEKVGDVGIDDEPIAGSENLVKSGGVVNAINQIDKGLQTTNLETTSIEKEVEFVVSESRIKLYNNIELKSGVTYCVVVSYLSIGSFTTNNGCYFYSSNDSVGNPKSALVRSLNTEYTFIPENDGVLKLYTLESDNIMRFSIYTQDSIKKKISLLDSEVTGQGTSINNLTNDNLLINQKVNSFDKLKSYDGFVDSTQIVSYGKSKYKIIEVAPGVNFHAITSDPNKRVNFAILSNYNYNHSLPYNLIFAQGESSRRSIQHEATINSLPIDAKFIAINLNESSSNPIAFSKIEVGNTDLFNSINGNVQILGDEVKKSSLSVSDKYFIGRTPALGNWYYDFSEQNAFLELNNQIVVQNDGDYIEFNIKNTFGSTFNYGLVYSPECTIGIRDSIVQLRLTSSGSYTSFYGTGARINKIKIARSGSNLVVYLNGVLNATTISNGVFSVNGFGKSYNGSYIYNGKVTSIIYNGNSVDFSYFKTIQGDNVIIREPVFLSAEQYRQVREPLVLWKDSSNSFVIEILNRKTGNWVKQRFVKQVYSKTCYYGDNQSINLECANIWYMEEAAGSSSVMQGVQNYIYQIDSTGSGTGFENENGYVGGGHGGVFNDWIKFYLDDEELDINNLSGILYGNVFRMTGKASYYAIDTSNPNYTSAQATLKLDDDGNKILSCVSSFDYKITENLKYELDNQLTILRNNTKFYHCFGSAFEVRAAYFNGVSVNNKDCTFNSVVCDSGTNIFTVTPVGSAVNLKSNTHQFANIVNFYNNNFRGKQTMIQYGNRDDKNNLYFMFYEGSGQIARLKVYMCPCINKLTSTITGATQETFNSGDCLVTRYVREVLI